MDMMKGPVGHMVAGLNQDKGLIGMTSSEMVGSWIHVIGGVMTAGSILVLVQRDNIIITTTIHIGGVRSNTYQGSSRKKITLINI